MSPHEHLRGSADDAPTATPPGNSRDARAGRARRNAALIFAVVLLTAGCTQDGDASIDATAPAPTSSTIIPQLAPGSVCPEVWELRYQQRHGQPVQELPLEEDPPEIVDIRFARHDTCERVVIDFDRTAPRPTTRLYLTALEEALGDTGCWDLSDRLCDLPRTPAAIEVTFGEQPVALRDGVAEGDVDGTDFSLPACPLPEELVVIKDCLIYTNYGIGTKGLILGTNDAVAWSVRVLDNKVVVDVSTVVGVPVG